MRLFQVRWHKPIGRKAYCNTPTTDKERGQNNIPNYASQLQTIFAREINDMEIYTSKAINCDFSMALSIKMPRCPLKTTQFITFPQISVSC